MTDDVVARVLASTRYRDVDRSLLERLARDELPRARNADDAVKRVKRRLHQAVGAYRGRAAGLASATPASAWAGTWDEPMLAACRAALARHASTRERLPELETFYPTIWEAAGSVPRSVLDLACGLNPFALPFMRLDAASEYLACDVDRRVLDEVGGFLSLVGQPHRTWPCDLVDGVPEVDADVALLLKTLPLLDRQEAGAAGRLLARVRARHIVVSFPVRSLGGRGGLARTYEARMERLLDEAGDRVASSAVVRFRSELVFVLRMSATGG